jgi:hypothetical protein
MKKLYTFTIALSLFITNIHAQITLNSTNWPAAGVVETNYSVDVTSASEGSAGANQTWDFSSLPSTGTSSQLEYVAPSATPYFSSFPTANSAVYTPSISGSSIGYGYYNNTSSFNDLIGFVSDDGAGTVVSLNYSDPERALTYPFTYGTSFTDSYYAVANYTISGTPVTDYRFGTNITSADAYGTVMTPAGTYNNVLRIKTTGVNTDSLDLQGFPFVSTSHITTFTWVNQNTLEPFVMNYDTSDDGMGGQTFSKSGQYTSLSTGISDLLPVKPLAVYPNPSSSETIHLNADNLNAGNAEFIVADINGRIIKNLQFTIRTAARKTIDVDMSDVAPGIYSVRLLQENSVWASRYVRQ